MPIHRLATFKQHSTAWIVVLVIISEVLLIVPVAAGWATLDTNISLVAFATLPAFAVTIAQLARTQQTQRAAYIKDFLTEFRRNGELFVAFYDLVYRYHDRMFDEVERLADQYVAARGRPDDAVKPVFDCFDALNVGLGPGSRYYHPQFFQFSPEEKRLDGLLDYFNAIGLYVYEGLIRVEDVVTMLGDYLAVIADRRIVQEYLRLCQDVGEWKYDDTVGASPPYQHLVFLLEVYKEYNLRELNRKRLERLRSDIDAKEREVQELRRRIR